jgi:hypothetical protein
MAGEEKYLRGMVRRRGQGWDCASLHICTHTSREGTALCKVHCNGESFD